MWQCACCDKVLPARAIEWKVMTEEGDVVSVGSDCAKKIIAAGVDGHYHNNGNGPFYSREAHAGLDDC